MNYKSKIIISQKEALDILTRAIANLHDVKVETAKVMYDDSHSGLCEQGSENVFQFEFTRK